MVLNLLLLRFKVENKNKNVERNMVLWHGRCDVQSCCIHFKQNFIIKEWNFSKEFLFRVYNTMVGILEMDISCFSLLFIMKTHLIPTSLIFPDFSSSFCGWECKWIVVGNKLMSYALKCRCEIHALVLPYAQCSYIYINFLYTFAYDSGEICCVFVSVIFVKSGFT